MHSQVPPTSRAGRAPTGCELSIPGVAGAGGSHPWAILNPPTVVLARATWHLPATTLRAQPDVRQSELSPTPCIQPAAPRRSPRSRAIAAADLVRAPHPRRILGVRGGHVVFHPFTTVAHAAAAADVSARCCVALPVGTHDKFQTLPWRPPAACGKKLVCSFTPRPPLRRRHPRDPARRSLPLVTLASPRA